MLTQKDIQNLIRASEEIFATKKDYEEMRQDFSKLQTSVDGYALRADKYFQEMLLLSHKVDRHERWIFELADKAKIKLNYSK